MKRQTKNVKNTKRKKVVTKQIVEDNKENIQNNYEQVSEIDHTDIEQPNDELTNIRLTNNEEVNDDHTTNEETNDDHITNDHTRNENSFDHTDFHANPEFKDRKKCNIVTYEACPDITQMNTSLINTSLMHIDQDTSISCHNSDHTTTIQAHNQTNKEERIPQTCLDILENTSPANLLHEFNHLEITIKSFIQDLPVLNSKTTKKLIMLAINKSINVDELIELTQENDRNTRMLATLCCLNRIKSLFMQLKLQKNSSGSKKLKCSKKENSVEEDILHIFDNVYLMRYRDVDSNIRAMCIEYMSEYIVGCDLFVSKEYLKYVGWGLNDKNENVRKKTLRGCGKILGKVGVKRGRKNVLKEDGYDKEVPIFFNQFKKRVIEMCNVEKNEKIKNDSANILIKLFKKRIITKDEIFKVLEYFTEKEVNILFNSLREEFGIIHAIEEIFKCNENSLEKLVLTQEEINTYVDHIKNDKSDEITDRKLDDKMDEQTDDNMDHELNDKLVHKTNVSVSSIIASNMGIKTLSFLVKPDHDLVGDLMTLLNTFREDIININYILVSLIRIQTEYYNVAHEELIDTLIDLLTSNMNLDDKQKNNNVTELVSNIFTFMKKIQDVFPSKISLFTEGYKIQPNKSYLLYAIRSFDFSDMATPDDSFEIRILSCFWRMIRNDFRYIEDMQFEMGELGVGFTVAVNYLLYCWESIKDVNFDNEEFDVVDVVSAIRFMYEKIKNEINTIIESNITGNEDNSTEEKENYTGKSSENNTEMSSENNKMSSENKLKKSSENNNEDQKEKKFDFKKMLEERKKNKGLKVNEKYNSIIIKNYPRIAHIIPKHLKLLFYSTKQNILESILKIQNKDDELIDGLFLYLHENDKYNIEDLKVISQAIAKKVKNVGIFNWIRRLGTRQILYDSCFVFFVKLLSVNECVALENGVKGKSKYKNALVRRCASVEEFRTSPVRKEEKDIVRL